MAIIIYKGSGESEYVSGFLSLYGGYGQGRQFWHNT